MKSEKKPRLPIVGEFVRGSGVLEKIELRAPPRPKTKKFFVFKAINARCELRLDGKVQQSYGTLWDYYGLETCLEEARRQMEDKMKGLRLSSKSDAELVVVKIVLFEVSFCVSDAANNYNPEFVRFDDRAEAAETYRACGGRLPEPVETDYWSSKHGPALTPPAGVAGAGNRQEAK